MPRSRGQLIDLPAPPNRAEAEDAHKILEYALEACSALLDAFDASRRARRATGGNTTTQEQDLLRAMVVFAGAGLDASVKRLIENSLPILARRRAGVRQALEAFAARRLRDEAASAGSSARGYTLLAAAISNPTPQAAVVTAYVEDLLGSSLQSVDRVFEALSALGIQKEVSADREKLKNVFTIRNNIVHEMDMDLSRTNRYRTTRRRDPMIEGVNTLLCLGWDVTTAVAKQLPKPFRFEVEPALKRKLRARPDRSRANLKRSAQGKAAQPKSTQQATRRGAGPSAELPAAGARSVRRFGTPNRSRS